MRAAAVAFAFAAGLGLTGALAAQLVVDDARVIYQSDAGGLVEPGDHFGAALAAGDFDGDGAADLAIGVPDEGVGAIATAGGVVVFYGSRAGLDVGARPAIGLHQDVAGVEDAAEAGDRFGAALAAGDFDRDGYDDLVVAVPWEDSAGRTNTGALHVFFGSATGLDPAGDQWLDNSTLAGETGDRFGVALAACDRTDDGYGDLVVGSPGRDADAGMAWVFSGSASGLQTVGAQLLYADESQQGDALGSAIACGDLDSDGEKDFLVGAPYGDGNGGGTSSSGAAWLFKSTGGMSKIAPGATDERWGGAVAIATFGAESAMLVGGPAADWFAESDGAVLVTNLAAGSFRTQEDPVCAEASEPFDGFGGVLAAGDFDHDGLDDALFGVPEEDLLDGTPAEVVDAGLVHVLYGMATNTGSGTGQTWSWEEPLDFGALDGDRFGAALAVGDFDADGVDDLAIGAPGARVESADETGLVQILYGQPPGWIFGDDFERGDTRRWSAASGG